MFSTRVQKFIEKSSFTSAFVYLKEVLRITIRYLAGQDSEIGKVHVQCDSHGLPTIIPWKLREQLLLTRFIGPLDKGVIRPDNKIIVCILTSISIFRIFSTNVKPSLKSIVQPFNGITKDLDINKLILIKTELFGIGPITSKTRFLSKPILLETSSPNASKSTWGSGIDAIAFLFHPKDFYNYIRLSLKLNYLNAYFVLWIIILILFAIPFISIFAIFRLVDFIFYYKTYNLPKLHIAKLSVVYDQAGKARIVGISNYWVQCLLKPIHNFIFRLLKGIEEDGTFDQLKPLNSLIKRTEYGQVYYSFDLSAATDRLPIQLQCQILNLLFNNNIGTLWGNLLSQMPYSYKITKDKYRLVKYSVGQPMGALSSWAMLALTHHFIVRYAALQADITNFKEYAILGDDVVIANDAVAENYFFLMNQLGVSINMQKTIQSHDLVEFAKKWKGPYKDYTPIGPGLLLQACRSRFSIFSLLLKMREMDLIEDRDYFFSILRKLPKFLRLEKKNVANNWYLYWFIFLNAESKRNQTDVKTLVQTLIWCFSVTGAAENKFATVFYTALKRKLEVNNLNRIKILSKDLKFLLKYAFIQNVSKGWIWKSLEFILKLLTPGYYLYLYFIIKEILKAVIITPVVRFKEKLFGIGEKGWNDVFKLWTTAENPLFINIDFFSNKQKRKFSLDFEKSLREQLYREAVLLNKREMIEFNKKGLIHLIKTKPYRLLKVLFKSKFKSQKNFDTAMIYWFIIKTWINNFLFFLTCIIVIIAILYLVSTPLI